MASNYNYKWKKPTPTEAYNKTMRELDKWIKDDMIKNEELIEKLIQKIKDERNV
jgi:hypothetical protein